MILLLLLGPVLFLPIGFGAAAYLDSERQVIARVDSPGGYRTAQLERLVVGGAPNMVVTVRRSWQPDWYLTSCKSVSYYGDAAALLYWLSDTMLVVDADTDPRHWDSDAPFRWNGRSSDAGGCGVTVDVR